MPTPADDLDRLSQLDPVLEHLLKTLDATFPNNKGVIVAIGISTDEQILSNVGGNGKTDYQTASMIMLDMNHYIGDVFGRPDQINNEDPRL